MAEQRPGVMALTDAEKQEEFAREWADKERVREADQADLEAGVDTTTGAIDWAQIEEQRARLVADHNENLIRIDERYQEEHRPQHPVGTATPLKRGGGHEYSGDLTMQGRHDLILGGLEERVKTRWERMAQHDVVNLLPKAVARGGHDLYELGESLVRILHWDPVELGTARLIELGLWFYLRGKVARAQAALEQGQWPDADTLHDMAIYTRMIEYVREYGGWPWHPDDAPPDHELTPDELRQFYQERHNR